MRHGKLQTAACKVRLWLPIMRRSHCLALQRNLATLVYIGIRQIIAKAHFEDRFATHQAVLAFLGTVRETLCDRCDVEYVTGPWRAWHARTPRRRPNGRAHSGNLAAAEESQLSAQQAREGVPPGPGTARGIFRTVGGRSKRPSEPLPTLGYVRFRTLRTTTPRGFADLMSSKKACHRMIT
jgi:hypothetical protein